MGLISQAVKLARVVLRDASQSPSPPTPPAEPLEPANVELVRADTTIGNSQMSSIINTLTGQGGVNDKGAVGRPNTNRQPLDILELEFLYRFNGYVKRGVDQYPKDGTRKGYRIIDSTDEQDPLAQEMRDLGVQGVLKRAGQWARLYGASAVFIVAKERGNIELSQPLELANVEEIVALIVLDGREFLPVLWGADMSDPKTFRLPTHYQINPARVSLPQGQFVHASRLLYFAGSRLPISMQQYQRNQMDESIIDVAWDAIRNLTSIEQSGATMAQDAVLKVLKVVGLAGQAMSDTNETYFSRMLTMASTLSSAGMAVVDASEDLTIQSATLSGWAQLGPQARLALSAVFDMPQTLLYGETPGGLTTDGESQRRTWGAQVADWQQDNLLPPLTWLVELLYTTKGGIPDMWQIEFNPLDELTTKEEAEVREINSRTDGNYIRDNVYTPQVVREARFGEAGYQDITMVEGSETEEEELAKMTAELEAERARREAETNNAPQEE